jgi:hypothetical protein
VASLWSKFGGILRVGGALVFCDLCPCDESSSGSSSYTSGSGGSSEGCTSSTCVEVPCCPGVQIPTVLTVVVTGGSCAGTYSMVWDGRGWVSGDFPWLMEMTCETFGWYFQVAASAESPTSEVCSPFQLEFSFISDALCGTFTATVTG